MRAAFAAFRFGLTTVARRPLLVLITHGLLLIAVAPLGARFMSDLDATVAGLPLPADADRRLHAGTWESLAARGHGFVSSFTPTSVGFAAALRNIEALVAGAWPSAAAAMGAVLVAAVWVLALPTLALAMLGRERRHGALTAGVRHLPRLAVLTLLAAAVVVPLLFVVHPWLLQVFDTNAGESTSNAALAVQRLLASVVVVGVVFAVTLLLDVARLSSILFNLRVVNALRQALATIRANAVAFVALGVLYAVCWTGGLAAYAAADLASGRELGYWRVIVIGQLFLLGRVALRLVYLASQLHLIGAAPESVGAD